MITDDDFKPDGYGRRRAKAGEWVATVWYTPGIGRWPSLSDEKKRELVALLIGE